MLGALLLIIILAALNQPILAALKKKHRFLDMKLMNWLFGYHVLFALIYYIYTKFARSDSVGYYLRSKFSYSYWFEVYQTGTGFVDWLSYPFTNYLFFTYEMMMLLFAWFGYIGFVYFYLFFRENLRFTHKLYGVNLLSLVLFLPNMHYWTASLGKGSIIFMGLAMAIYGISRIKDRKLILAFGMLVIYHVRPHIFLFMGFGIVVGILTGREKIPMLHKLSIFAASLVALILLYDDILAFAKLDSENLMESFDQFSTNRAAELAKSGSGIDTSNYPMLLKLVTFWYRPLFFDAPGVLGLIVSVENVVYVVLTAKLFQKGLFKFIKTSPTYVKTSLILFLTTSIALSGTLSNLGIIIRQKSMVMYFLLFTILVFMDYKKTIQYMRKQKLLEKQRQNVEGTTLAS